jgi:hypothetical protein
MQKGLIRFEPMLIEGSAYANFWAPGFHQAGELSRGEQKRTLRAFRLFEDALRDSNIIGWVSWVENKYPNVQKILRKLGGRVFIVTTKVIWFKKELR